MRSEPGEVEENLKKIEEFCVKAASQGANIVCFPELSITGYLLKDPVKGLGGFSFDYIVDVLIQIAKKTENIIIAGLVEPESNASNPYITQVIVDEQGILGKYRKTHLSPMEKDVYSPGDDIPVFSAGQLSLGIELCYDVHFPEISTIMALKGAEVIFIPHASPRGSPKEKFDSWIRHLRARAFDNGLFIVAYNQVGTTRSNFNFPGVAIAIGPDGGIIDCLLTEEENIMSIAIDKKQLYLVRTNVMRYFLPHRRPERYRPIIQNK